MDTAQIGKEQTKMSFADALRQEMENRQRANETNAAIQKTIPDSPKRGSYYWWANVCRENTGQHMLDSGMAYGYAYNAPVPPENVEGWAHFSNGEYEYATINTIKWLTEVTEADDNEAEAIEEILHWVGNYLYWSESWNEILYKRLAEEIDQLLFACSFRTKIMDTDGIVVFHKQRYITNHLEFVVEQHQYHTDRRRGYGEMDDKEYIAVCIGELPVKAIKHLYRITEEYGESFSDCEEWGGGGLTYNEENAMSQDFQFSLFEFFGETYAAIQTHNGCDIRGGYSTPVVARVDPYAGFFDWRVDYYCHECSRSWDAYEFHCDHAPNMTPEELESLVAQRDKWDLIQAGQQLLPGFETVEALTQTQMALVQAYEQALENDELEEFLSADAIIEGVDPATGEIPHGSYDVNDVQLWCSACREYAVRIGVPLYH